MFVCLSVVNLKFCQFQGYQRGPRRDWDKGLGWNDLFDEIEIRCKHVWDRAWIWFSQSTLAAGKCQGGWRPVLNVIQGYPRLSRLFPYWIQFHSFHCHQSLDDHQGYHSSNKNLVDVGEGLLPQTLGHSKGSQLLPHVLHLLLQLLIPGPELCVFLNISNYNTIVRMFCLNDWLQCDSLASHLLLLLVDIFVKILLLLVPRHLLLVDSLAPIWLCRGLPVSEPSPDLLGADPAMVASFHNIIIVMWSKISLKTCKFDA